MPWGDSGIYGGCCTGLKPRIFAQNCRERGWFEKMMIPSLWLLVIIISENDDHKKSPNSQFHGFLWSSFSYIYIRMIIRSHRDWVGGFLWSSFSQIAPFPPNFEQKFGVWGLYSIPHICQNHPRASVKKVIIGYLIWITNNPPDQIWAKSF